MADRTGVTEQPGQVEGPSMADLIDRLSRFDGPPDAFLTNLLAVQCYLAAAGGGAILRLNPQQSVEVLAIYPQLPQGQTAPVWLAQAVEFVPNVLSAAVTVIRPLQTGEDLYGAPPRQHLIMVPIRGGGNVRGAACFLVDTADQATLAVCRERLELTVSLLSLYEMRLTLQRRQVDMNRLRLSIDLLAAVNEHERFAAAAMALCNELASRLGCERVSLGFLKGQYVHLRAQSHTEKFSRKMKVVQDIEAAMEECLDQDVEVVHPASPEATFVARSTKNLAIQHGPTAVLSLPLRRAGEAVGVLTLERVVDRPFLIEEVESLRLVGDLATARMINLHEHDRWFGARMAGAARKGAAFMVGTKHTWAKLLGLGIAGLIVFMIFAKGDYQAEAPFVLESTAQQALPSPFDARLKDVFVHPGSIVVANQTVLGELDTREHMKLLTDAQSDRAGALAEADKAMKDAENDPTKMAEYQSAMSRVKKADEEIALQEWRIKRASITSPISGTVISEDLKKHIGRMVKTGDVLFEVAPVESLRAVLEMPEDEIAEVRDGNVKSRGQLATTAYPERRISFGVDRINPVAEMVEQKNVFKVRVNLDSKEEWMRPGMKGVAKVDLGRRPYYQLWSQKLVNWVRMKLWI